MVDHTTACLVALLLGLIALGLAGLSCWLGEAMIFFRGLPSDGVTRKDYPFWFWFVIGAYVVVGALSIYGGIDGLIHGSVS